MSITRCGRLKGLIDCGLIRVVVGLCLVCGISVLLRCTILSRVGCLVTGALSRGIDLCGNGPCACKHQNAYHNDMHRPVKEAVTKVKKIVFVSHDYI